MVVRVRLIRIGNSRGIRIPKTILNQCRFEDIIDLEAQKGKLVLTPVGEARRGWSKQYRRMAESGDDALLDAPLATDWDRSHWQW